MSRYDVSCNMCFWQKNVDKENQAYRWAGFHEGENPKHKVTVEKQ